MALNIFLVLLNFLLIFGSLKISSYGKKENISIPKNDWKVIHESVEGFKNAIDDNYTTLWHAQWRDNVVEVIIDLGANYIVKGFYLQHQLIGVKGNIKRFKLYTSLNLEELQKDEHLLDGLVGIGASTKQFFFKPREVRYFKFVVLEQAHQEQLTRVSELGFYEGK